MSNVLHFRSGQNVCSSSCPVEHIDLPGDKIKEPSKSWPDIRGLNSLNFSRTKWLTGDAIEVSIEEYCRGLPQALQDTIGLGIPGLRPEVWHRGDKGVEALSMAIAVPQRRALAKLSRTEYSLFPVCVNHNHWVLVFMRKAARNGAKEFLHVRDITVIDPEHKSSTVKLVYHRLHQWLTMGGNFTFSPTSLKTVWVPLQRDSTSCGPRAYWNAKQLMDRLLELHEGVIRSDALWYDLSGWFNEDFVRSEMTGRCAWAAVRGMDYKARVAVECVNRVREYDAIKPQWKKADQLMKAIDIKNRTPERRPQTPQVMADDQLDYVFDDVPQIRPGIKVEQPTPVQTSNPPMPSAPPRRNGRKEQTRGATAVRPRAVTPVPSAQGNWKPSAPMLNQHRVMPDLKAGAKEPKIVSDSADEEQEERKGPAFSKSVSGSPIPMGGTKSNAIYIDSSPSSKGSPAPIKPKQSANDYAQSKGVAFFSNSQPEAPAKAKSPSPPKTAVKQQYGLYTPATGSVIDLTQDFSRSPLPDPYTVASPSKSSVPPDAPVRTAYRPVTPPRRPDKSVNRILFPRTPSASSVKTPVTFPSPGAKPKQRPRTPYKTQGSSPRTPIVLDSPKPGGSAKAPIVLDDSPGAMAALAPSAPSKRKRDNIDDVEELFVWGAVDEVRNVKKARTGLPKEQKSVSFFEV